MSEHIFYSKGKRANHRKVRIGNIQCLLNKAKEKRIKLRLSMTLSGQKQAGTPEWISAAHVFVAQNHDPVSPQVEFSGFDIAFSSENLFGENASLASKCQMKKFVVTEQGGEDDAEVVLNFLVYAPFSTGLWEWAGQMIGDDVWAKFEQIEAPDEDLLLTGEDEEEETEEEEE